MKQIQKRLAMLGCMAIGLSSMALPLQARNTEPRIQMIGFGLQEPENKVDGKNIKGISQVTTAAAIQLAQSLVSSHMPIRNARLIGVAGAFGQFEAGKDTVGFDKGLVLSTGGVHNIFEEGYQAFNSTPNNEGQEPSGTEYGFTDENFNDIAILEFEVMPTTDSLSFQYVLASEEYPQFANSPQYFDEFILMVNGKNYAKVPNTQEEVSIGTVNHLRNTIYYRGIDYMDNSDGDMGPGFMGYTTPPAIGGTPISEDGFVYNGATKVFSVNVKVTPNEWQTIRLGIGDKGDHVFDSSVFIKAESIIDKPVTPGVLAIASKKDNTIFVNRDEGTDGYVAAEWTAYGLATPAPIALLSDETVSSYAMKSTLSSELVELGAGKVDFNDGQKVGQFDVPVGTVKVTLDNVAGGATTGTKAEAEIATIPEQGTIKEPKLVASYKNKQMTINIDPNGNASGYQYIVQRAADNYMLQNKKTIKDWSSELVAVDADVQVNGTYYYQVKVKDANGFESTWSKPLVVKAKETTTPTNPGGSTSDSSSSSSSSSSNSSTSTTKSNATLFKEKYEKMTKDEKQAFLNKIQQYIPYTLRQDELETFIKQAIEASGLDKKDKKVLLENPELLKLLDIDGYHTVANEEGSKVVFGDVAKGHWASEAIYKIVSKGIIKGYENETFRPKQVLNYEETFAFLDRVVGNHAFATIHNSRSVVETYVTDSERWGFYTTASIASKISEDTLRSFGSLQKPMTREVLAQVIFELTNGKIEGQHTMPTFKDFEGATYQEALTYCVEIGLLKGVTADEIAPTGELTRAQMVTILDRLDNSLYPVED